MSTFYGTDKDMANGHIVGYDSFSGKSPTKTNPKSVAWCAFALEGGMVMIRLTLQKDGNTYAGPILKGAGKYQGIQGTAIDRPQPNGTERVTLHYHF
jgi:hypothetical protein